MISSKDNAKIKMYKKLAASKKYRDQTGMFVVEGMRNCVDLAKEFLIDKSVEITALFFTKQAINRYAEQLNVQVFERINSDIKYEISEEIAEKMSVEEKSQGVFIIAKKVDKLLDKNDLSYNGKYLVLDSLQDPGNVGTMIRTAAAVALDGIVLTNKCCDLYNPKVVRSAMASMPKIDIYVEDSFENVCEIFRSAGIKLYATVVNGGNSILNCDFKKGCAVVIGNEGRGLSDEHVLMCDEKITIEMKGNTESLNAAIAGTIIAWEMSE